MLKWPQPQPRTGNIHVVGYRTVHADEVVIFQHLEQPERRRTHAVCYLCQNSNTRTHPLVLDRLNVLSSLFFKVHKVWALVILENIVCDDLHCQVKVSFIALLSSEQVQMSARRNKNSKLMFERRAKRISSLLTFRLLFFSLAQEKCPRLSLLWGLYLLNKKHIIRLDLFRKKDL